MDQFLEIHQKPKFKRKEKKTNQFIITILPPSPIQGHVVSLNLTKYLSESTPNHLKQKDKDVISHSLRTAPC